MFEMARCLPLVLPALASHSRDIEPCRGVCCVWVGGSTLKCCCADCMCVQGVNNFEWHSFNSCSSAIQVDMPRNTQPWVLANTGTVTLLHATVPGGSQRIMSAPHLHLRQVAVFRLLVQSGAQHLPTPDSICVVLPLPGEESCTGPPVRLGFLSAFPDAGPTTNNKANAYTLARCLGRL